MVKNLRCLLGLHRWYIQHNDEGQRYRTCRRCGRFDDPARHIPLPGGGWS